MFQKKSQVYMVVCGLILAAVLAGVCFVLGRRTAGGAESVRSGEISRITIGSTPIGEYQIVRGFGAGAAASQLQQLIYDACGEKLRISGGGSGDKRIIVKVGKESAIHIQDGTVEICGADRKACMDYVYFFANRYLGYAFAGGRRQHILTTNASIVLPESVPEYDEVWMPEREPIICLWKTDTARGTFPDRKVSLKSELMSYSDDQLYEYVKMMHYCGFTGIQVTDMCSAWAQYGGYEFVQDRIRFMADAAHSLGMKFTLWVWGAEFDGYGWIDHSVVYYNWEVSANAREIPEVVETFDKYYSIYAQLADCSDRLIMHFNDPGQLRNSSDIGFFARMLREKCLAVNPELDFGISCYTYGIDLTQVREFMEDGVTVYGGTVHLDADEEPCRNFRAWAAGMGFPVGVWSWNLAEMEIDQLAEMNVNARLIADCYRRTRLADEIYRPAYWSEMDSYHMVNLFSLYCSGQLLQDPDLDADLLLYRISEAVVGKEYADDLCEVLSIIQDARCGADWSEFKIGYENYLLESDRYPAEMLAARCEEATLKLEEMIRADLNRSSVPLAISTSDLLSMILPHVAQIREFAEFRMMLEELEKKYASGESAAVLQNILDENYKSIPEYNTIVGVWGQAEARAQYNLVKAFCEKAGLETPVDAGFEYLRRQRLFGEMVITQKKSTEVVVFPKTVAEHWSLGYGNDSVVKLVEDMISEGILTETPEGEVYLTDWENYRYDF